MTSNIYCHRMCAKHCSKCFICICLFKPLPILLVGTIIPPKARIIKQKQVMQLANSHMADKFECQV